MKIKEVNAQNAVAVAWANPDRAVEIAKQVPQVADKIVQAFPDKIMELVEALPEYAGCFATQFPKHALEIARKQPGSAVGIVKGLNSNGFAESHDNLIMEIARAVPQKAVEIARVIPRLAPDIAGAVPEHNGKISELFKLED